MTCQQQLKINDYLDQQLDPVETAAFEQHIADCVDCQTELQHGRLIQRVLATIPYQASREGFFQTAFERVRLQYPEVDQKHAKSSFLQNAWLQKSFVGTVLAGFVLWAVFSIFLLPQQNQVPTVQLTLNQTLVIPLAFNATENFDKVTLTMQIPIEVELNGHKGKRSLSWDTQLKKGSNLLRIPLTAIAQGNGLFIASLKHGNKVKTFTFQLNIKQADFSNKQSQLYRA